MLLGKLLLSMTDGEMWTSYFRILLSYIRGYFTVIVLYPIIETCLYNNEMFCTVTTVYHYKFGGRGCFSLTSLVLEGLCRGPEMEGASTGSPAKPAEPE